MSITENNKKASNFLEKISRKEIRRERDRLHIDLKKPTLNNRFYFCDLKVILSSFAHSLGQKEQNIHFSVLQAEFSSSSIC